MECNRDEGLRAKGIAEKKFGEKDITGAKKFALKAQSLYPGIDGIQQLLAALNVHMCVANKIGGEPDWYGVLGVDPVVDHETVKRRYRMLALSLHPDKNKSVGAAAAFSVLKDAWDLLSDKTKRVAYDKRRSSYVNQKFSRQNVSTTNQASKGGNGSVNHKVPTAKSSKEGNGSDGANGSAQQKIPTGAQASHGANGSAHQNVPSGAQGSHQTNGIRKEPRRYNPQTQMHRKRRAPSSAPVSAEPIPESFWSECPKCTMRFEYPGNCLRCNVHCMNCHKIFQAVEIVPPALCGATSTTPYMFGNITAASQNVGETGFISRMSFTQNSVIWIPFSRAVNASQASNGQASGGANGPLKDSRKSE